MMTNMDISFIGQLLADVGTKLLTISNEEKLSLTLEEMFERFEAVNSWAADTIRTTLAQKYPHIHWSDSEFNMENQYSAEYAGEYWVCDPLDGAAHFLQGIAFWSTSLVLVRNGVPSLSFVYDPVKNELFHAIRGEGAFLNGSQIAVANKKSLSETIVSTSPPTYPAQDEDRTKMTNEAIASMMIKAFAVRMLGSTSLQLAYVACGRLDGYWEFGHDMHDWLAGQLIASEAGAIVTDSSGGQFTWGTTGIIAANRFVHEGLQAEISPLLI